MKRVETPFPHDCGGAWGCALVLSALIVPTVVGGIAGCLWRMFGGEFAVEAGFVAGGIVFLALAVACSRVRRRTLRQGTTCPACLADRPESRP